MSIKLIKSLLLKSSLLQQKIELEQRQRRPNHWRLLKLKKLRLMIADRLQAVFQHRPRQLQLAHVKHTHRKG